MGAALESATDGGTQIRNVWDPAAGSVSSYGFPAIERWVRRDESRELVREFLARFPRSAFWRWGRTLV
jgi:hypothetical protein